MGRAVVSGRASRARLVASCVAITLLAGCNAFDRDLLAPGTSAGGIHAPPMDDGGEPLGGSGGDGDVMLNDAAMPPDRMDAAMPEAGPRDASDDAAPPPDATSDDAALDSGAADGGDECAPANVTDYCTALPQLANDPVIDGELECGLPLLGFTPTGWNGAGTVPEGHDARFAFARTRDGLYAYVEVRGQAPAPHPEPDAIFCGDAIEIYVDADGTFAVDGSYDTPGTAQLVIAAPASLAAPNNHAARFIGGTPKGAWTSTQYKTVWFEDGYALEARIVADDLDLESWEPGSKVGIDVVIDVAGPAGDPDLRCGLQLGQYFWRLSSITPSDCDGEPWCDTRAFCAPPLL